MKERMDPSTRTRANNGGGGGGGGQFFKRNRARARAQNEIPPLRIGAAWRTETSLSAIRRW